MQKNEVAENNKRHSKHRVDLSNVPEGYFVIDFNLVIHDCNQHTCDMFRMSKEALIGRTILSLSPEYQPDGRKSADHVNEINTNLENADHYVFDWLHSRMDGSYLWCEVYATVVRTSPEPFLFCSMRDITDRIEAEENLKSSVSLLNATLESTCDGILVVSTEGKIRQYNKRFLEMWKVPKELYGVKDDEPLLQYVTAQLSDPQAFLKRVLELYSKPTEVVIDELHCLDGRILERYTQPQFLEDKIIGRIWSFRDITEKKFAQSELLQAEKLAAVGSLAAGVAHNFNNINTGIIGHLEMLLRKETGISEDGRKKVKMVIDTVKRSAGLTTSLMRIGGKGEKRSQQESISNLLFDTVGLLQSDLNKEHIRLECTIEPDVMGICCASDYCHVLFNLLNNARHAFVGCEREHRVIQVTCNAIDKSCVVQVIDNGRGIPIEDQPKVFSPFFTTKGENAVKGSGLEMIRGTGLGLSSSRAIINEINGSLTLKSMEGIGSTFTITIPCA